MYAKTLPSSAIFSPSYDWWREGKAREEGGGVTTLISLSEREVEGRESGREGGREGEREREVGRGEMGEGKKRGKGEG